MTDTPKLAVVGGVKWPEGNGYPVVYVEESGDVREVTAREREILETAFDLDDGARPYVMSAYTKPAWWRLRRDGGFCPRHLIPRDVSIRASGDGEVPGPR